MKNINTSVHKGALAFVNDGSLIIDLISKELVALGTDILFRVPNVYYCSERLLLTRVLPEYLVL